MVVTSVESRATTGEQPTRATLKRVSFGKEGVYNGSAATRHTPSEKL